MTRDDKPSVVKCGSCGEQTNARVAREGTLIWPLNNSGKGGTHAAAGHLTLRVYCCPDCWDKRLTKMPPEVLIVAERLGALAVQYLHFAIAKDAQRDLFGNVVENVDSNERRKAG